MGERLASLYDEAVAAGTAVVDGLKEKSAFVQRLDKRNLKMGLHTARILSRPSLKDWNYNRSIAAERLTVAAKGFIQDQDRMNDFQMYSPEDGYVSTPEDGVLAGVTKEGRLSSFFSPSTGFTQQIPYFVWDDPTWSLDWEDGPGPLALPSLSRETTGVHGSKPREGGFLGYRKDGEVTWLWEDGVDHELDVVDGQGTLELSYTNDDIAVEEQLYVLPGEETAVRDFAVENLSDEPLDGVVYYTQANANDSMQYPLWASHRNHATADDAITWQDTGERSGVLGRLRGAFGSLFGGTEEGPALRLETDAAVMDAGVAETDLDELFKEASSEAVGSYIGGYLELDETPAPGETQEFSVFMRSGAENGQLPGREKRQVMVEEAWEDYLADVDFEHVDEQHREQYRRSLNALMMLYDPHSGSISAAPNTQPAYYPSWIRDASFSAVALAKAGKADLAKDYLARFCQDVQEEDGSFKQCYGSNKEFAGIIEVENDQQPAFVWAVREVYEETGDEAFLEEVWPAVEDALEYSSDAVVDNGLLAATHDFAEMPKDARQSLWTNALAYQGFLDGAFLADELGKNGDKYREQATGEGEIGDVIDERFFEAKDEEGFYTHLNMFGERDSGNTAFAAAMYPSDWAADYGREEEMLDELTAAYDELDGYWLPKELMLASSIYRHGDEVNGDAIVDRLAKETTPAGSLVEEVHEGGEHLFATLGWSQATYILAMEERYGGT